VLERSEVELILLGELILAVKLGVERGELGLELFIRGYLTGLKLRAGDER